MESFSEKLKEARVASGHRSASSFYSWLKLQGISFNYSYYKKMENGGLPSEKVVNELAMVLKGDWADQLILSYCKSLFPNKSYLFQPQQVKAFDPKTIEPDSKQGATGISGQRELSLKQIEVLCSEEAIYHLFLLTTLARAPIQPQDLTEWFTGEKLQKSLEALLAVGIIISDKNGISPTAVEAKFPEAYNAKLKQAYAKFDEWDEKFGGVFGLEFLFNKMLIRRVSSRYIPLIKKQLEVLAELVKSSDELDNKFNDRVVQVKVMFRQGNLPG